MNQNGTLRVGDVARRVGLTRQHMTRLCRNGDVPGAYQTAGGHWRVGDSLSLARWILARAPRVGAADAGPALLALRLRANEAQERRRLLRREIALCRRLEERLIAAAQSAAGGLISK